MAALVVVTLLMMTFVASHAQSGALEIDLLMPAVQPQDPDTYLCMTKKVDDVHRYISGFVPKADPDIAHHMLLFGCEIPGGKVGTVWNCGEMTSTSGYKRGAVCAAGRNIIYAWALDAPRLNLPTDVSFDVGSGTASKYLVLQVHYKNITSFKPPRNNTDSSGVTLVTSTTPTTKEAAILFFGTSGYIPANSVEYFEAACVITADVTLYPFAYRVHTHSNGRVVAGYRIRNGNWTEMGRKDPRLPQMFYNVTNPGLDIKKNDVLAFRCTMENLNARNIQIGPTVNDEMCNLYLMYYVDRTPDLGSHTCQSGGPPYWFWTSYANQRAINLAGQPKDVSIIPGTDTPYIRRINRG